MSDGSLRRPQPGTLVAPPGESPRAHLISELSSFASLLLRLRGLIASGQAVLSQQLDRAWGWQDCVIDPEAALPDTAEPEEAMMNSVLSAPPLNLHRVSVAVSPVSRVLGRAARPVCLKHGGG